MLSQDAQTYIKVPYPAGRELRLNILVPKVKLVIVPGLGTAWITGRYDDPQIVSPLHILEYENSAKISAYSPFSYHARQAAQPAMRLSFGRARPFSLSIIAEDLDDSFDLGGIPLTGLDLHFSDGSQVIDFSHPNPQRLRNLNIESDTGKVLIKNLANSGVEEVRLNGGSYSVHFGGSPRHNTRLRFGSMVARAEVSVPAGTAIHVASVTPPTSSQGNDFSAAGRFAYLNGAAWNGADPLLSLRSSGAGPLKITYT